MTITDLVPDDEDGAKYSVERQPTGYQPSNPPVIDTGAGETTDDTLLDEAAPDTATLPGMATLGFGAGSFDQQYADFIMTGVVSPDSVLGYQVGGLGSYNLQELLDLGLENLTQDEYEQVRAEILRMIGVRRRQPGDPERGEVGITRDRPIRRSDIVDTLSDRNLAYLAMDIFLNVDGAYRDIDEVFDDDGTVNIQQLNYALERTFQEAMTAGPAGFGTTTEFLEILVGDRDLTGEELQAAFDERAAELEAANNPVVLLDPVGLAAVARDAFGSAVGRRATKAEQQQFVRMVHGLQMSGQQSIDTLARAEQFARGQAPEEAAAMDYAGAAGVLMQALGIRQ